MVFGLDSIVRRGAGRYISLFILYQCSLADSIKHMRKYIIYGDIGGTKTLLQMAECVGATFRANSLRRYRSGEYRSFADMLNHFLNEVGFDTTTCSPVAACFAVAGPIVDQRSQLTNLPWLLDAAQIARAFSIEYVKLLNDFEAAAMGVDDLAPEDLVMLQSGCAQPKAMRVILGAGTGMGVAWLIWHGNGYRPLPTEAGHIDFAPTNALQIRLLERLQNKFQRVSVERLLSGTGLTHIFKFLLENHTQSPDISQFQLDEDSGAAITALATEEKHPVAIKSLELFAEIYGAYAGNLALAGLCRNGVYIAGGIAPKIIDTLRGGAFIREFCRKGRFSGLMKTIPVQVIINPDISLLGAKNGARELMMTSR
ncbi:glucokinase [Nitrosomonas marina]|uniref:Glucokinase n=2 Tax=Nitrosomonas marina TaxID=917 RepID=A0A1I0AJC5_9PROT|nr:glucokinase [Nitrosomonas marina]